MNTASPFIGVDFGTSRSTMAWFNPETGQAEVIRNAEGKDETPSIVYFGAGETLVGDPAEAMLEDPEQRRRVVCSVKRDLVNQPRIALVSRRVTAIEVAATILGKLRRDAEELHFHRPVQRAVITCPAAFDELQLDKINEAARQAGFTEVALVPEPVAAALAYAQAGMEVGRHVLVYDLGGGTFDLALLAREPSGSFRVALEPKGLARCGGDDFDRAIYDHCDEVAESTLGRGITLTRETDLLFLRQCRQRKETLSATERCGFNAYLTGEEGATRFSYEMTRATFEDLIGSTVEATVRLTGTLVQEAKAADYPVETVVLIGGSSRIPLAQRRLQETLPVAPQKWQKQDVAVALGAALHGHLLWDARLVTPARPIAPASAPVPPRAPQAAAPASSPAVSMPSPAPQPTGAPQPIPDAPSSPGAAPAATPPPAAPGQMAGASTSAASPSRAGAPVQTARPTLPAHAPVLAAPRTEAVAGQLAAFGPRLGAYVIDFLVTYLAAYAIAAIATAGSAVSSNDSTIVGVIWLLVQVFYYGYCWSAGGRTLGYRLLGLRLAQRDGSAAPVGTALLRYLSYLVCALPVGLGFLWMLWDPRHETWAEKLTGTFVVTTKATR